jgi:peptidoglycan/LPS O-acetylase OafA/YrhL
MLHRVRYLSNLTPLRGVAALLVAIFHFEMVAARFVPARQTLFFEKCYLMVDLFFVMSGFILLHVYGEDFRHGVSKGGFRKFLVARFARIYPLHIFTLFLLVVWVVGFMTGARQSPTEDPAAIPANIFLLQSFYIHNIYTWNIPAWSISAEWWAYMVFPFLVLFIGSKKRLSVIVLSLFVVAAYISIMYLLPRKNPLYPAIPVPHNINATYDYGFLRGLAGFITGMLVYLLYQMGAFNSLFRRGATALLLLVLLITALHLGVNDAWTVLLFSALVLAFACNDGYLHKVCNNRVLQYIGDISYSIYLMQIFLQEPFSKGLRLPGTTGFGRGRQNIDFSSGLYYCILYLLGLVAISSITYYLIERPCRTFINRKWGNSSFSPVLTADSGK